ncbi:MAG: hypothetical protein ACRDX9_04700 [Acidimicrobiia bacterium]
MRRLLLLALIVVISGVVLASAASLGLDGGVLQEFRLDVTLEVPSTIGEATIEAPLTTNLPAP